GSDSGETGARFLDQARANLAAELARAARRGRARDAMADLAIGREQHRIKGDTIAFERRQRCDRRAAIAVQRLEQGALGAGANRGLLMIDRREQAADARVIVANL